MYACVPSSDKLYNWKYVMYGQKEKGKEKKRKKERKREREERKKSNVGTHFFVVCVSRY